MCRAPKSSSIAASRNGKTPVTAKTLTQKHFASSRKPKPRLPRRARRLPTDDSLQMVKKDKALLMEQGLLALEERHDWRDLGSVPDNVSSSSSAHLKAAFMRRVGKLRFFAVLSLAMTSVLFAQSLPPTHVDDFTGHPRVVIISDIGNEPDDQMSFVRLLLYSNELD